MAEQHTDDSGKRRRVSWAEAPWVFVHDIGCPLCYCTSYENPDSVDAGEGCRTMYCVCRKCGCRFKACVEPPKKNPLRIRRFRNRD